LQNVSTKPTLAAVDEGQLMKKLISIYRVEDAHWVGDGFPVRTIFSHQSLGQRISPFLLLDYAGPAQFPPSGKPRGVDEHPTGVSRR
jgi:quercetin 2,3-dioxygenase